jgi:hypothetical protein
MRLCFEVAFFNANTMPSGMVLTGNKLFSHPRLTLSDIGQAVFENCPAHIIYIYLSFLIFHIPDRVPVPDIRKQLKT